VPRESPIMFVPCPTCDESVHLDVHLTCPKCRSVVQRCIDCMHYRQDEALCAERGGRVHPMHASKPTRLSISARCHAYEPEMLVVA